MGPQRQHLAGVCDDVLLPRFNFPLHETSLPFSKFQSHMSVRLFGSDFSVAWQLEGKERVRFSSRKARGTTASHCYSCFARKRLVELCCA